MFTTFVREDKNIKTKCSKTKNFSTKKALNTAANMNNVQSEKYGSRPEEIEKQIFMK